MTRHDDEGQEAPSEAIGGHQRSSERSSEVIRGHQSSSEAISPDEGEKPSISMRS
jgi:hypothetical protein